MTYVRSSVLSALRKCKKRSPIWSVWKSCAQSKIKWTVKSPSKVHLKEVKCIMWKVLSVRVSWHLLLCQGPLLWSLSSSFEGAREGSLLLQSLSFISTPSHHPLGEGKRHKQTGLAFYTSFSSLPHSSSHSPLPCQGTLSPLWPENFIWFGFLLFSLHIWFTFTSPSFSLPVAFFTLFHVVNIYR